MKNQSLNIGHIGLADKVLGFGKRLMIWVAGCPFRCDGCIQPEYLPKNSGKDISLVKLLEIVNNHIDQIDGITFSGGEPFWQADSLSAFIDLLPSTLDKMVFTGYQMDELNEKQIKCFSKFDLVVDGRYEKNQSGNYLWRGSSNQKFYSPSKKYDNQLLSSLYKSKTNGISIKVTDDDLYFYGIPANNEINFINTELINRGILTNSN